MYKFFSIISTIDFCKRGITMNFKSKQHSSTAFSLIISLAIYIYVLYAFFSSDMFLRQNLLTVRQSSYFSQAETVTFDQSKHFSISLTDNTNTNLLDFSIFSVTMNQTDYYNDENGVAHEVITKIPLEPCTRDHGSFDPDLYQTLGLHNQLCSISTLDQNICLHVK